MIALFLGLACNSINRPDDLELNQLQEIPESAFATDAYPNDFPAEQDLTILLDLQDEPMIAADDKFGREAMLPLHWLRTVTDLMDQTEAEGGMDENYYSDWRLVSLRIVPCNPLGIRPDQDIDTYCWPMVRLVWQPVIADHFVGWTTFDYYADDRAIHALYPLAPRDEKGQRTTSTARQGIADILGNNQDTSEITDAHREIFLKQRNQTIDWLLQETYELRSRNLSEGSWSEFTVRSEIFSGEEEQLAFQNRLTQFLMSTTDSEDLSELTAFSLPPGRDPAGLDTWIFLAFEGENGRIRSKEQTIIDRYTGKELINIGFQQSVGMSNEDPSIEDAIAAGAQDLENSVVPFAEDSELIDEVVDPYQFLVPNTSCASCHKANELRFDFHNLSHLEDRDTTVSPRVRADVAREMVWTQMYLWNQSSALD